MKLNSRLYIGLGIFLFAFSKTAISQDLNYATWIQAGVEFEIVNDLDFSLTEIIKQDIAFPVIHSLNTDLEIKYKPAKKWTIAFEYRLKLLPYETINRLGASVSFREGVGKVDLYFRSKYQYEIRQYRIPDQAWRNRIKLRYELTKDIYPYIAYELFLNRTYIETSFNTYRLETGSTFELNKHNEMQVYLMLDQEIWKNKPETYLVAGLAYQYTF
ncbi:MAG: DUF2490 domain-containing protein [Chitinophagales bacterium]